MPGPVVKGDQCAQNLDDIGIPANIATDLTRNIRATFKCFRQAGLKPTIKKCHFGTRYVEFLGRTLSPEGISHQTRKTHNLPDKLRFPESKKALQRYLGFVNYQKIMLPGRLKNVIHSTNCSKRKRQSILRQNRKKY